MDIDIISLLSVDGYIMCNKALIRKYGSDCAIIIGELCAEYNYYKVRDELIDDYFFSTQENIENNTGINAYYQRKALKTLQEEGIIDITKKGMPARNYYKINVNKLAEVFSSHSASISEGQVLQALHINNNKQITFNNKSLSKDNDSAETEFNFGIQEKPKKTNLYVKCLEIIDEWTNDKQLKDLLVQYLNVCLEMKCIRGANQWKGMLNTLERVQQECAPHTFAEIIEQSIIRSWKTFYPIRDYPKGNSNFAHIQKSDEYVEPTNEELKIATDENGNPIVF